MSASSSSSLGPSPAGVGWTAPAAVMVRVRGPDPHRRKVGHSAFFGLASGTSTLTASGTLCLMRMKEQTRTTGTPDTTPKEGRASVHVICHGDILAPFLVSASSCQLADGVAVDVLVETGRSASTWWRCALALLADTADTDAAVHVLTQGSSDWELGWSKPQMPPALPSVATSGEITFSDTPTTQNFGGAAAAPSLSSFQYPSGRRRTAALFAVLQVLRPTAEAEAEAARARPQRPAERGEKSATAAAIAATVSATPSTVWPAHYPAITPSTFPAFHVPIWLPASTAIPRGTAVSVLSSPYGLLSPHIFHNTLTRGIVSNLVRLDERERGGRRRGHFGSPERSAPSALADVPPSLLLIDARCFSGSEGAPVLTHVQQAGLEPTLQPNPPTLLGFVTLPIRHAARGSAVELNLAVPAYRVEEMLEQHKLSIWTPASSVASKSSLPPFRPSGRGEGWRIVQQLQRSALSSNVSASSPPTQTPTALEQQWSLIALPTAAPRHTKAGRSKVAKRTASTKDFTEPPEADIEYTAPIDPDDALVPLSALPSAPATPSLLPTSSCTRTVELVSRSVLIARIGGSWASAIVLTGNGYLLTNAHLVRPFLEAPETPPPSAAATAKVEGDGVYFAPADGGSTPTSDPAATSDASAPEPELLYGDAIRLKRNVKLSVRLESTHMHLVHPADEDPSLIESQWVHAQLVYVSQGPWDVAILKVNTTHPLHAVAIHPSYRHATAHRQPECLPLVGSRALAVGHALFAPGSALEPTVTAGVLSKIVYLPTAAPSTLTPEFPSPDVPSLLVTSAAVHNGNSGGLLVDEQTGYLLGIVTSNVMHTPVDPHWLPSVHVRIGADSSADEEQVARLQRQFDATAKAEEEARQASQVQLILPHLNFTIPYTALLPLVEFCEGGAQDVALLRSVEAAPDLVQRLYQLQYDLHPDPTPTRPNMSPKYERIMQELERNQNANAKL